MASCHKCGCKITNYLSISQFLQQLSSPVWHIWAFNFRKSRATTKEDTVQQNHVFLPSCQKKHVFPSPCKYRTKSKNLLQNKN